MMDVENPSAQYWADKATAALRQSMRGPGGLMPWETFRINRQRQAAQKRKRSSQQRRLYSYKRQNTRTGGYLGIEYKFLDTAWDNVAINSSTDGSGCELQPSSGCTNCISCPAEGDGESARDGRTFVLKSAYFSGTIDFAALTGQTTINEGGGFYFALVLDTQTNGAAINSEDVYINPSTIAKAIIPQPLRNLEQSNRFRILDRKYVDQPLIVAGSVGANFALAPATLPIVTLSWKGSIKVNTKATASNVTSVTDNSLHILAFAANTAYTPIFTGKCRVRFVG